VQEWQEDDPLAPIKGSTLTINLTTSGGLSLLDFYSDNDNEFKVKFIEDTTSTTLFEGFILQDDCSEVQVDFIHEITLKASDNLGTIKDITLNKAAELFGDTTIATSIPCVFNPAGPYIVIDYGPEWPVQPGQTFTIDGTSFTMVTNLGQIDLVYTGWCIQIVENISTLVIGTFDISYKVPISLDGYIPLLTFIKLCLRSTYLNLPLSVINHITPADGVIFLDTGETRIFEDVLILSNTFLKGNEYMSCYDVLEIIMKRFNMSCFQAHNSWWIVRYPDLFLDYQSGETVVDYYKYDVNTFNFDGKYSINRSYIIASGAYVETGLLKSIIRPYRRTLETFNYVQPEDLLVNSQFTDLGYLINNYVDGSNIIYNYYLNNWTHGGDGDTPIRVVYNSDNKEIERYVSCPFNSFADSQPIELNIDDTFEYSFSIRTNIGPSGAFLYVLLNMITLTDGTTTYYLKNDGSWTTTEDLNNLTIALGSGQDMKEWTNATFKANKAPINGALTIKIRPCTYFIVDPDMETYWKDLRLTVSHIVAGQGQINGHTHTSSQSKKLNNINDYEIFIDNSERSTISGTLFENRTTGLLQDKITNWKFGFGYNTGIPSQLYSRLGQLITDTYMFQRYIPRSKFNGNLLFVRNQNGVLSNLAIFSNEFGGDLYRNKMLLGSLAIDYKNDSAQFTMWEVFNSEFGYIDNFTDFTSYLYNILYQFNYLYENN
jgi:hypothetical protein